MSDQVELVFRGATFDPALDQARLATQLQKVWWLMRDGEWRTLRDIAKFAGGSEAAISARLRDLRKRDTPAPYGSHIIERRRRGDPTRGLFEYRMVR